MCDIVISSVNDTDLFSCYLKINLEFGHCVTPNKGGICHKILMQNIWKGAIVMVFMVISLYMAGEPEEKGVTLQ
jgi:hypothetical protein